MKISILEKMRAPSRNMFCEGLVCWAAARCCVLRVRGCRVALDVLRQAPLGSLF